MSRQDLRSSCLPGKRPGPPQGPPGRGCICSHSSSLFFGNENLPLARSSPPSENQRLAAATATRLTPSHRHIEAAPTVASSESRRHPRCCLLGTLLKQQRHLFPISQGLDPPLGLSNSDHLPRPYSGNSSAKHLLQEALLDHLPNPSRPPSPPGARSKCNNSCYHMGFCASASTCNHHQILAARGCYNPSFTYEETEAQRLKEHARLGGAGLCVCASWGHELSESLGDTTRGLGQQLSHFAKHRCQDLNGHTAHRLESG